MELAHVVEETRIRRRAHLAREHQRYLRAIVDQLRQRPRRLLGIPRTLDPVITSVALELALEVVSSVRIFVDCEQDREGHGLRTLVHWIAPEPTEKEQ
jgi:hypothetical protein